MEVKFNENKLLHRKEVTGTLAFTGATPSNKEVQTKIAEHFKVTPEQVAVKHIYTDFGKTSAKFEANVYDSKEALDKLEPKKKAVAQAAAPAQG